MLTEVVANRDVAHAEAIRYCPVTVQPYVDKRVELRVTVVGDRAFAVALDSQWTNHTRHDWRRGDHHHGRYAVHDLPPAEFEKSEDPEVQAFVQGDSTLEKMEAAS